MRSDFSADVVTVPGSLRVYRQWALEVHDHRLRLCSLLFDVPWRQQEYAECKVYGCDRVPEVWCHCGIYGYYSPDVKFCDPAVGLPKVLHGSIKVQGSVVLGTKGVRAQSAVIEAVVLSLTRSIFVSKNRVFKALQKTYPDIDVFSTLAALVERYPPDDVTTLIEE